VVDASAISANTVQDRLPLHRRAPELGTAREHDPGDGHEDPGGLQQPGALAEEQSDADRDRHAQGGERGDHTHRAESERPVEGEQRDGPDQARRERVPQPRPRLAPAAGGHHGHAEHGRGDGLRDDHHGQRRHPPRQQPAAEVGQAPQKARGQGEERCHGPPRSTVQ
jgi:hypothetical protein